MPTYILETTHRTSPHKCRERFQVDAYCSERSSRVILVQLKCLTDAMAGSSIICEAHGGRGKSTTYILATLHQLADGNNSNYEIAHDGVDTLVLCPMREMAYSIANQFEQFSKYLPEVRVRFSSEIAALITFDHPKTVLQV